MSTTDEVAPHPDARDLARFGYRQELRRTLGVYSSFAVAFSYISPSTGIFTLYALGLGVGGPFFIWSWPIVVMGQAIVGLNFAEISSHFPVAGSVARNTPGAARDRSRRRRRGVGCAQAWPSTAERVDVPPLA